ncbi:hypothetical protein E4U15_005912 [Claviceps sp. LM218 group G6]|nr:hypothetical protein E4U15_005912 [Claviceps sp. LM218 group G6]
MSSNQIPTQTGSSAANRVRPQFAAAMRHLQSFTDSVDVELDKVTSLPALNDAVEWEELRTQVAGHENRLTEVQGAVEVNRGDHTTLGHEVIRIRGDLTTLEGQFTTFQNVVADLGDASTSTQGNMTVLTENVRLLGEGLGQQIRTLSDSTARLTEFMTEQAEVNIRLEAL